jgi:hypothetical protein
MIRYILNSLCLLIAIFTTSCYSLNQGNISSNVVESNFTHKETVMGQSSSIIILGIGVSKRNDLVNAAKRDLETKRFLAPNERYINYVVDKKTTFYPFGIVVKQLFTVHADVIAINQEEDNPMSLEFKENYIVESRENLKKVGPIALGKFMHYPKEYDPVYLADGSKAFFKNLSRNKITVVYISGNTQEEKQLDNSDVYFEVGTNNLGIKKGDELNISNDTKNPTAKGKVIAFSSDKLLVKDKDQNFMVIDPPSKK